MSEVDRLSNSGLYPVLPIADRQRDKDSRQPPRDPRAASDPGADDAPDPNSPRPPKSIIDEYA